MHRWTQEEWRNLGPAQGYSIEEYEYQGCINQEGRSDVAVLATQKESDGAYAILSADGADYYFGPSVDMQTLLLQEGYEPHAEKAPAGAEEDDDEGGEAEDDDTVVIGVSLRFPGGGIDEFLGRDVDVERGTVEGKSLVEWYAIGEQNQAATEAVAKGEEPEHVHPHGDMGVALLVFCLTAHVHVRLFLQAVYCSACATERQRLKKVDITAQALGLDLTVLEAQYQASLALAASQTP